MKRYLLAVLLAISSMGALASSAAAENFKFSLLHLAWVNPFSECEVNKKIEEFIQKEKNPFGVFSLSLGPNYSMKASILDNILSAKKCFDMIAELGVDEELEIIREGMQKLIELLSKSGFKQSLSDSIIELLAQVGFEFGRCDTIDVEIGEDDVKRIIQLLTQLESMGVITTKR